MTDTTAAPPVRPGAPARACGAKIPINGTRFFWVSKRGFDFAVATLGLPILLLLALALLVANPIWNPGPLIFRQDRMGRDHGVVRVWKFRTMLKAREEVRGPEDPVETHRITPMGAWLRRTRLDEMPQLLNVLVGEMSLVGPRPDSLDHAKAYLQIVPGYGKRHVLRPGITGLAQVNLGYVEGSDMVADKVAQDLYYIRNAGWRLETAIIGRTFLVMATGSGAR